MASVLDSTEIDKLKVADLKKELKSRGLSTIGNKIDLFDRLQESIQSATAEAGDDEVNEDEALGEDELLAEDQKSDLLICEDAILSAEKKEPAKFVLSRLPTVEKENLATTTVAAKPPATTTPVLVTSPVAATTPILPPKKLAVITAVSTATPVAATGAVSPIKKNADDPDKLVSRAKRFNVPLSDDARKNARAERFGVVSKNGDGDSKTTSVAASNPAKLQQRAKRFGSDVEAAAKPEDGDRLLKRKARFGAVVAGSKLSDDAEEKKRKRAERFGLK